ncbi:MAG: MarR family transcriptional regulator [Gammaproteobacteria bacterium]|nr:MarR family transcriptional regulator [Gammaproteobacteria bacterium]
MPEQKQREAELVMDVIRLHNQILKRAGGALSVHGLGLSEYLVLNQLSKASNQSMRRIDLAEQIGLSPSGVTRLLNPMVKVGLIEKQNNPRDARVSLVALSATGKRVYEEARVSFQYASVSLFTALDEKRLQTFSELVNEIV